MAVLIQSTDVKKNTKGRPALKKETSRSTKRNPSAFEHVEDTIAKQKLAKKQTANAAARPVQKLKRVKQPVNNLEEDDESLDGLADSDEYVVREKTKRGSCWRPRQ
jgi:hypothetical protein